MSVRRSADFWHEKRATVWSNPEKILYRFEDLRVLQYFHLLTLKHVIFKMVIWKNYGRIETSEADLFYKPRISGMYKSQAFKSAGFRFVNLNIKEKKPF